MKKLLSCLLSIAMLFSLCALSACGDKTQSQEPSNAPSTPDEPADPGNESRGDAYDTITLQTATSYNESDYSGSLIAWMADYLEEKSGGAVKLECYYGGAFCADAEVYDYVMAGDLQLSFVQPVYAMTYFPFAFGIASAISNQNAVDTANNLIYNNPETAALIEAQGAANNLHLLGHTSAGSSIFLSKREIGSFEEASQYTIGSPINLEIYASYGFGTVAVEPADMYDALSRGVCDLVAYSAANVASQKLYEVAPYVGDQRAYFTNQIICVNNEVWNSLNPATQQLLIDAAMAVCDYSVTEVEKIEKELFEETIPAASGVYHQFTEEEGMEFNRISMVSTSNLIRGFAENLGCSEDMEIIIQGWADGLGQEGF